MSKRYATEIPNAPDYSDQRNKHYSKDKFNARCFPVVKSCGVNSYVEPEEDVPKQIIPVSKFKAHDKESSKYQSYRNSSAMPRHNPGNYATKTDYSRPQNRRAYEDELQKSEEYRKMQEKLALEKKIEDLPKLPELTDPTWFESSDEETKLERIRKKRKEREDIKRRNMKLMTKKEAKQKFQEKMEELRKRVPGQRATKTSEGVPLELPNPLLIPAPILSQIDADQNNSSDEDDEAKIIARKRAQRKEMYDRLKINNVSDRYKDEDESQQVSKSTNQKVVGRAKLSKIEHRYSSDSEEEDYYDRKRRLQAEKERYRSDRHSRSRSNSRERYSSRKRNTAMVA